MAKGRQNVGRPTAAKKENAEPVRKRAKKTGALPADELSGEVAIRAHIDHTGLTVTGKSRFLAATDRLFGGIVGIPAEYFEGIRARLVARNTLRLDQTRQGPTAIKLPSTSAQWF